MNRIFDPTQLSERRSQLAAHAANRIARYLSDEEGGSGPVVPTHELLALPKEALRLVVSLLEELGRGHAVTVVPLHAELTTQQAADLLNVSRPHLVKLLESAAIPFRRVGNRRKIQMRDLVAYKRVEEAHRRKIAAELTAEAQELGLGY